MSLPSALDPIKTCKDEQTLQGELGANELPRLDGLKGKLHYCFTGVMSEKKEPILSLALHVEVVLTCQRCNQPMSYVLDENVRLEDRDVFNPIDVIEDEIILALPMIPMHSKKDCNFSENAAYSPAENENKTYKPFADLSKVFDLKE